MIIMYTIYYTTKARLRSYGYAKWHSKLIDYHVYYILYYTKLIYYAIFFSFSKKKRHSKLILYYLLGYISSN